MLAGAERTFAWGAGSTSGGEFGGSSFMLAVILQTMAKAVKRARRHHLRTPSASFFFDSWELMTHNNL
jgi:hypothetical protein